MNRPITTRLPKNFIEQIKYIAEKENLDNSSVIRRLLAHAIKEWKIKYALELYSKGEFSFGQAAKFSDVSVWDFPDLLKKNKIETAVMDLYCIKPFNEKKAINFVKSHGGKIVIAEDHYAEGGVGEMLAEELENTGIKIKIFSPFL